MEWFRRKKRTPSNELTDLLLTDKIDQLANVDAIITLLIRKGIFTKAEFDQVKQEIRNTDQYKNIYKTMDAISDLLSPDLQSTQLTYEELMELLKALPEKGCG